MYQDDQFGPTYNNDYDEDNSYEKEYMRVMSENKRMDKGYNVVHRRAWRVRKNKRDELVNKYVLEKIEVYSSDDYIRDAETGEYLSKGDRYFFVGSKDEDIFYKVIIATGECKSKNSSNAFFFLSPHHYETHMNCTADPESVQRWEMKRNVRLNEMKNFTVPKYNTIEVR